MFLGKGDYSEKHGPSMSAFKDIRLKAKAGGAEKSRKPERFGDNSVVFLVNTSGAF